MCGENMDNKKKYILVFVIIFLVAIISGSTYSYWKWRSPNSSATNVVFTTSTGFTCGADGGGNITQNEKQLLPTNCSLSNDYVIKRQIKAGVTNTNNTPIYMDLWLDIKNITTPLSNTNNFRYAITDSANSCNSGNVLVTGSFQGMQINQKVDLLNTIAFPSSGTKTYYLYIWMDYSETNVITMDQPFHLELGGECRDRDISENTTLVNKPYLYNTGLIPVKLSDNGATVTSVSENDSTWYDYSQKK